MAALGELHRGLQTHPGTRGTADCPWLAPSFSLTSLSSLQLGAHSHIPVWGKPFPPLHRASLCLLYPEAPPFVLGSKGPLRLCWLH